MATAKQGTCCKTLLFPKFEACVIQPSTRTSYKSSGNFLAASNMKQGQTSWNVLITSKDSSLEEIGSNDKSICRGWLAIMPCKDVGKAADSADLPKPTDTETLVVFFCKEKSVSSGSSSSASLKSSFVANVKRGEALLWAITALRTLRSAHGIVLSHSRIHSQTWRLNCRYSIYLLFLITYI